MSRILILMISIGLALAGCSSNRGDPTTPGGSGSLSPGAGKANTPVTRENLVPAFDEFFPIILNTYKKAGSLYSFAYSPELPVRLVGNYNGYAIVRKNSPAVSIVDSINAYQLNVEYSNYFSETGTLFILGKLDQYLERNTDVILSRVTFFFNIDGTVEFSGNYACTVRFDDFKMALDKDGQRMTMFPLEPEQDSAFGRITVRSGAADSIRFNPFFYSGSED